MKGKVATFGSAGPRTSKIYDLRSAEWTDAHNHTSEQCPVVSNIAKQARRPFEGRIDCDRPRGLGTGYGARSLTCTRPRTSIQRSRKTADLPAAMGLSKTMISYPVSDIFNPNRHLPHPPTSERCSDFKNVR